jgi:hypothetical protein
MKDNVKSEGARERGKVARLQGCKGARVQGCKGARLGKETSSGNNSSSIQLLINKYFFSVGK